MVLALLVLVVGVSAYLSGGPYTFVGHSAGEIEKGFQVVPKDCSVNPSGGNPYKFCEATCPNGFYAVGGSCQTYPGDDGSGNFVAGLQYNLLGVLPESGLQSYSCFNNGIVNDPSNYLTATATCMQSGGASLPTSASCGNYRIDSGEVCDTDNFGDWIDCTDFSTGGGNTLCNGTLSCNGTCSGFDVSACVYCNNDVCGAGLFLCADGLCRPDCTAFGGDGSATVGAWDCPTPGTCPTEPDSPPPGHPVCGNALIEGTEQCEGNQVGTSYFIICPDGTAVDRVEVCSGCQWQLQGDPCSGTACNPYPSCVSHASCGPGLTCALGCCIPWDS